MRGGGGRFHLLDGGFGGPGRNDGGGEAGEEGRQVLRKQDRSHWMMDWTSGVLGKRHSRRNL